MQTQCASLSAMLINGQQVTHRRHIRGWIETPDGRHVQPDVNQVRFVAGCDIPVISQPRRRWFARLMGIFA